MKRPLNLTLLVYLSIFSQIISAKDQPQINLSDLGAAGEISQYMVLGPIPAPQVSFGYLVFADELEDFAVNPSLGNQVETPLIAGGKSVWSLQSIDGSGFLDLHQTLSSMPPGTDPERVWHGRSAFVSVVLVSESAQELKLLFGTASESQVFLNGQEIYRGTQIRGATPDENSIPLALKAGENQLVFKIFQSHHNYGLSFFGGTPWQWGLYARLVDAQDNPAPGIKTKVPGEAPKSTFDLVSTPFYKESLDGSLIQKFQLRVTNSAGSAEAHLSLPKTSSKALGLLPLGQSVHDLWLPARENGGKLKAQLNWADQTLKKQIKLQAQRRWELYFIPFSHQDIGYTHTQPVTAEIQSKNLEDVLDYMKEDPDFRWTVETLWQAEQLFQRQGHSRRAELIQRVQEGRISLSPVWTNSFTGQLSEDEAIRSLEPAIRMMREDQVDFPAFMYNDTPGISWLWPGLLEQIGVKYMFAGINEVYNDYSLQRNLPKLFRWRGGDGGEVVTLISETYNEGLAHGLEKGPLAMETLMAEQLQRLVDRDWEFDHVALIASYLDNGGVPRTQIANINVWNAEYAWPRFIVATSGDYVKKLEAEDLSKLPVLHGDWTSPWETRSQGEPERMLLQREAQRLAPAAEKQNVVNWLAGRMEQADTMAVKNVYLSLFDYSGHGSGLEAGYANREDNILASSYRDQYVQKAWHGSHALAEREIYRLIHNTFSFSGQGVLVFNPSSFRRSEVVKVSFGRMPTKPLHVIDPRSNQVLPSVWEDDQTLVFLAKDMTSLGHTKYLVKAGAAPERYGSPNLIWDSSKRIIENQYLRIEYQEHSSRFIKSLYAKDLKQELLDEEGNIPSLSFVQRRPLTDGNFEQLQFVNGALKIVDLRPVGLLLKWESPDQVAQAFQISLWADSPILDIVASINLEALEAPETLEEIGLTLPSVQNSEHILAEVAGGWLNPARSILPGVDEGAISLRHGLLLKQKKHSIAITSKDARVVLSETQSRKNYLPVMNLVNNFPIHWNRNEVNQGSLDFRFQLQALKKGTTPADLSDFVAAAADPLFVRDSWMNAEDPEVSSFLLEGLGLSIQSMKPSWDGEALIIRIKNSAIEGQATGTLTSQQFGHETRSYRSNIKEQRVSQLLMLDGAVEVNLNASEILSIRIEGFIRMEKDQ